MYFIFLVYYRQLLLIFMNNIRQTCKESSYFIGILDITIRAELKNSIAIDPECKKSCEIIFII